MVLKRGDIVTITSPSGTWSQNNASGYSAYCWPHYELARDGVDNFAPTYYTAGGWAFPAPGLHVFCLVAKIGNGSPFEASNQIRFVSQSDGELFLALNDDYTADNTGSVAVRIEVE